MQKEFSSLCLFLLFFLVIPVLIITVIVPSNRIKLSDSSLHTVLASSHWHQWHTREGHPWLSLAVFSKQHLSLWVHISRMFFQPQITPGFLLFCLLSSLLENCPSSIFARVKLFAHIIVHQLFKVNVHNHRFHYFTFTPTLLLLICLPHPSSTRQWPLK